MRLPLAVARTWGGEYSARPSDLDGEGAQLASRHLVAIMSLVISPVVGSTSMRWSVLPWTQYELLGASL